MAAAAEYFPHHDDQLQGPVVADSVEDPVGIFSGIQDAFVAQYRQVLGNIALGGAHLFHYVLDADLIAAQCAQDFQPQWVRHGFEGARRSFNIFVALK